MDRYEQYKDSGDNWLGKIPSHWELTKLKFCAIISPKNGEIDIAPETLVSFTPMENIKDGFYIPCNKKYVNFKNNSQYTEYQEGDIAFAKVTPCFENNNIAIMNGLANGIGYGSSELFILRATTVDTKFLFYLLQTASFKAQGCASMTGAAGLKRVSSDMVKNYQFGKPSIEEQKAIAAYLDSEVSKIDEAIKQQQKMIELLNERRQIIISEAVTKGLNPDVKMKDSGIDWMGQINAEWRIFKLKYLIEKKLMYGANESAEDSNHAHPRYIRITDVNENGGLREETYRSLPPEKARPYLLSQGDILLARSGATAGKSFLFDLDIKACYAGYLIKATPNDKIAPRYLYYYTKSGIYECWCQGIHIQATIQNIGADKYANLPVPLPSLDEQNYIISYLDKKTEEVDKIVTASLDKIAILSKRKRIIINDVVTGKIKIG